MSFGDVLNFFSKRVRRIFPAYYLTIVLVLVIGHTILTSEDYRLLTVDTKWAMGFVSNIQKYIQNKDYFAEVPFCTITVQLLQIAENFEEIQNKC